MILKSVITLWFIMSGCGALLAQSQLNEAQRLESYLRSEVQGGSIVGAQMIVGSIRPDDRHAANLGRVSAEGSRPVTDDTLFCLASCSKPVASAVVFTLLDRGLLTLNTPAGDVITQFRAAKTVDGQRSRTPTLRELLAHRGGIYSQMDEISANQHRAIRDFRLTLDESVRLILEQPLSARPGQRYAYSGAGYMLVGKMAEEASKSSFEDLLQENLCGPLGMDSTTYFPKRSGHDEVATGGRNAFRPPHLLGDTHQLPLIGGSLYSTASNVEAFVRMLAVNQGSRPSAVSDPPRVLSERARDVILSPAFATQAYGYGWRLIQQNGKVVQVTHKGSLPPYQAYILIDVQQQSYAIVVWTLGRPNDVAITKRISKTISSHFEKDGRI